jgi:hypothetical protein
VVQACDKAAFGQDKMKRAVSIVIADFGDIIGSNVELFKQLMTIKDPITLPEISG